MKWSLRAFLICIPILALLLTLAIQYFFPEKPLPRLPVLGVVTNGAVAELPVPGDAVIKRTIDRFYESDGSKKQTNVVSILKLEELESWMDNERDYPLIGPAQLHHRLWLCEFKAVSDDGTVSKRRIHLDHNHFHQP